MEIPYVNITEENAEKLYEEYSTSLKERADELTAQARKEAEQLKQMAWHAKKGHRIIDIRKVMKTADVNEARLPKLAIAPINATHCYFTEEAGGAGRFSMQEKTWHTLANDVHLPRGTFPLPTETMEIKTGERTETRTVVLRERDLVRGDCPVPIIPPALQPKGQEEKYILFEVERWHIQNMSGRQSRDPVLLQRVNENMFIVLAAWDLTELEASVLK